MPVCLDGFWKMWGVKYTDLHVRRWKPSGASWGLCCDMGSRWCCSFFGYIRSAQKTNFGENMYDRANMSANLFQTPNFFEAGPELLRKCFCLLCWTITTMSAFHVNVKHVEMALQAFGFEYERAGNFTVNRRIREMSSREKKKQKTGFHIFITASCQAI